MKHLHFSSFFSKKLATFVALGLLSTTAIAQAHCLSGVEATEGKSTHSHTPESSNTIETVPVDSDQSGTQVGAFTFTFDNAFDYSSCMDIILLAHEQRISDLQQARQNQCANDVLATFGTNISRGLALQLVEAANTHATEKLESSLYPVLGIRRRVAINLGYIYDIDRNNPEVLKLLNTRG